MLRCPFLRSPEDGTLGVVWREERGSGRVKAEVGEEGEDLVKAGRSDDAKASAEAWPLRTLYKVPDPPTGSGIYQACC